MQKKNDPLYCPHCGQEVELLNTEEAAEQIDLAPVTVAIYARNGRLPRRRFKGFTFTEPELKVFAGIPRKAGRPRKKGGIKE